MPKLILRYLNITIMIILFLSSCQSVEKAEMPDNLIPKEEMITLLTDIAFIKAARSSYKKVFDSNNIDAEKYILEKYNVDSLQFAQSNAWYADHLDEYKEIFNAVKAKLETSKNHFEKLKREEDSIKKIKDSIDKAKGIKKEPVLELRESPINELDEEMIKEDIKDAKLKRFKPRAQDKKKQFP